MESKHVINFLSLFLSVIFLQGIYAQETKKIDTFYILFEENEQFTVKSYDGSALMPNEILFIFDYKNSLKKTSYIYDKISGEKMSISDELFKSLSFVDPWEVYMMIAKSEPKPKLFLISKSTGEFVQYEITIQIPPIPPDPTRHK